MSPIKTTLTLITLIFTIFALPDTLVIQQDLNGYKGNSDSYIGQGLPSNSNNMGTEDHLNVGRC